MGEYLRTPRPRLSNALRLAGVLVFAGMLGACGMAESLVEGFVDDQDYELYAGTGSIGTLIRRVDGTDVSLLPGVLQPGDTAEGHQALGVLGFGFDRGLQPDKTRLEWVRFRFWLAPGDGDVAPLGPLVVSHVPNADDLLAAEGVVPDPPGKDVGAVQNTLSSGWREVDVSAAFHADWDAGRSLSAFVVRFRTPVDDEEDADTVDLFPEVDGVVKRAHLVLHFGVDL